MKSPGGPSANASTIAPPFQRETRGSPRIRAIPWVGIGDGAGVLRALCIIPNPWLDRVLNAGHPGTMVASVRAVAFDYGNTLVEFTQNHVDYCDAALADALTQSFGNFDGTLFKVLREENRMAPYRNGYRENDLSELAQDTVERLFRRPATEEEIILLSRVRLEAFVSCIQVEAGVLPLMERLRQKYRTALLSNYPCGRSIRASLDRTGLAPHFDAVLVSGDIGWAKPHHVAFERMIDALGVPAEQVVFVGDNWLADVQGAKRAGLRVVQVQRWATPEHFDKQIGDLEPDWVIHHLGELPSILESAEGH